MTFVISKTSPQQPESEVKVQAQVCELCALPNRKEIEASIRKGEALHKDIAELYGISIEAVRTHMEKHILVSKVALSPEHEEKAKWLYGKAQQLSDLIDSLFTTELNAQGVKALVSALAELRQEIRVLAEIEGELVQKSNVTINQYRSLKMIVVGDLCADCKQKILEKLEKMEAGS